VREREWERERERERDREREREREGEGEGEGEGEREKQSNTHSALPITHCKRTGMQALAPAVQAQRGREHRLYNALKKSFFKPRCLLHTEQLIRLIIQMKGWLTEQRTWCVLR